MCKMHHGWSALALVALGLATQGVRAQGNVWRSVTGAAPAASPVQLGQPIPAATLERPMPLALDADDTGAIIPVSATSPAAPQPFIARGQAPDPPAAAPLPPPPPTAAGDYNPGVMLDRSVGRNWWDRCRDAVDFGSHGSGGCGRAWFQSDHAFDYFASPVTSPFYFEDPRSLTELKPVIIYQTAPGQNGGGNYQFFGLQGRLAFTEHFSVVINRLGFVSVNPQNDTLPPFSGNETGLSEFWLGPKYTFIRNESTKTVVAGGVTFQIPTDNKVFQDTGDLGIDPYISAAQNFRLPAGFGAVNLMGTVGYNFATDNQRTQYFHVNTHIDYNISCYYPFLEFNWYNTTKAGKLRNIGFEGADLINFGSSSTGGSSLFTAAAGLRYKFTEAIQVGGAVEFPLSSRKDLQDFRLTLDVIFRY